MTDIHHLNRAEVRRVPATSHQARPGDEATSWTTPLRPFGGALESLDAGADPATVGRWITETEAERARYQAIKRAAPPQIAPSMSREDI